MENNREKIHFMVVLVVLLIATLYTIAGRACTTEGWIDWTTGKDSKLLLYGQTEMAPEYKSELANAFIAASFKYEIPVSLLVAMSYYETYYRNLVGDKGRSIGIMQVGPMGRNRCECDMSTVNGQVMCGACWLDMGRDWCGSLKGGLTAYASGQCKAPNMRTKRAVNIRLKLAKKIRGLKCNTKK